MTIAWAARDLVLPPWQAEVAKAVLPQAEHMMMRGVGHVPMFDDPEYVAQILLQGSAPLPRRGAPGAGPRRCHCLAARRRPPPPTARIGLGLGRRGRARRRAIVAHTLLNIGIVLVLIIIEGVFVAAEIALVSLREGQVRAMAERSRRGAAVARADQRPEPLPRRGPDRRHVHGAAVQRVRRRHPVRPKRRIT